ncbi:fumarylacetoacetate hydrolase family protein [Actinocorallia sp. A-T 12471]|uniref:fumarylacetoacetate hydrolase family protein n=1 Tax=Actinocorallia sp. A-T 12471 TaxID=3089813 RepID=UPI0029D1BCB1|nr:fumarylacetoacetate hydrolase family protein [Actinocorallia sp. A-T 12471]MDX6744820.1 fumarylacetoacetate hydrolase family protein [Actinocorallia sp. A-T 12471]
MRYVSFARDGRARCGVVAGELVHPLEVGSLTGFLGRTPVERDAAVARALAAPGVPLAEVRLGPPLEPPTLRDFVAFEEHVEGIRKSIDGVAGVPDRWYEAPTFYFTNPHSLIGPYDDVPMAPGSAVLDFELEVAVVIGKAGRDLTPAQAKEHIFGYTIFNDWSARDLQALEMKVGLGPCKGKDFAGTLGPWIVTADELEPYRDDEGFLGLGLTAEVNGAVIGRDLLSNMGWQFEELVAYASRGAELRPGDVLGSGTCGNGGCLAELWGRDGTGQPPPLGPGDTVTLTVEGIGSVVNRVVPGAEPVPLPRARRRERRIRPRF